MNAMIALIVVAAYIGTCAALLSAQDVWLDVQDARIEASANATKGEWFCAALEDMRTSGAVALMLSGSGPCRPDQSGSWMVVSP